jgi:hypothetical protein
MRGRARNEAGFERSDGGRCGADGWCARCVMVRIDSDARVSFKPCRIDIECDSHAVIFGAR